ncbi:unnamed protein product [Caenorhabditis nigoni]
MIEPSLYSKHGKCRFENFPECLNNPNEIELGQTNTPNIVIHWFLGLERVPDPDGDRFRADIKSGYRNENFRISFQVLTKFWGRSGRLWSWGKYTKAGKALSTSHLKISEVLRNPYEWLKDGALEIEYGIHLEAYHLDDKIWNFNFREKSFNWKNADFSKVIIKMGTPEGTELYCDKELLKFHSQYLSSKFSSDDPNLSNRVLPLNTSFCTETTEIVLQIAHGVRYQFLDEALNSDNSKIVEIAEKLKLRNVSRYIERRMIQIDSKEFRKVFLKSAIRHDLNHYLAHALKQKEPMRDVYEEKDVQLMSRNTMMLIMSEFVGNPLCF